MFDVGNNEWNVSEGPSTGPVDTADVPLYPSDLLVEGSLQLSQGIGEVEDKSVVMARKVPSPKHQSRSVADFQIWKLPHRTLVALTRTPFISV